MNVNTEILRSDLTDKWYDRLRNVERIAWDIETSGLDWRAGKIGTCQLHAPEEGTVIVQVGQTVPRLLMNLLADASVRKVFHHAPFDLRWMVGHWGAQPASIDCTKVASRLVNTESDSQVHSLKFLLGQYLGVQIDKTQRLSDWLVADLSDEQLIYAAQDVTHLLPLLDMLKKEMENSGVLGAYFDCSSFLPTRTRLEVEGWPDVFAY